jgi:NAD(P)-dependent dehydrogenase (short-subunit alcohol dehydrogenase family)
LGIYNASKAALIHLTKQCAVEFGPSVRVNAVPPGVVRTKLSEVLWRDQEQALTDSLPLGRIGEPEDIGRAIAFLASDAAAWITGQILVIDGGAML